MITRAPTPGSAPAATPQRVAVVTTSYPSEPGDPSGHFVAAEVQALRRAGHHVSVIAPWPGGARRAHAPAAYADTDAHPGTEAVRWLEAGGAFGWPGALARMRAEPRRVLGAARFVAAARRELALLGALDRVVAHFIVPSAVPICAPAWNAKRALEVVAHGSDVRLLARLPYVMRRRILAVLRGADIRCTSAELREELVRDADAEFAAQVRVAPSPLDMSGVPNREQARRSLGIAAETRLLLVVGRLVAGKRVEVALGAAQLVAGAECVVVGDGPERAALARAFPAVRFVGRVPRQVALTWIAAADVLLSASRDEGAPSVVREARALGTRVAAVPAGDLRRWSRFDPGLSVVSEFVLLG
jgi:teichuronic acid biosynthesis glycosyltransferase TuaC